MKLLKKLKRFRTKRLKNQLIVDIPGLGQALDCTRFKEGHLVCNRCHSPFFYVENDGGTLKVHCKKCAWNVYLMFPVHILEDIASMNLGEFHCAKHLKGAFAVIKNQETLSIGCQYCKEEMRIQLYDPNFIDLKGLVQ